MSEPTGSQYELVPGDRTKSQAPSTHMRMIPILKVKMQHAAKLDTYGLNEIASHLAGGMTAKEIADLVGVDPAAVSCWLGNLEGDERALYERARRVGAGASMDRALAVLEECDDAARVDRNGIAVQLAVAKSRHFEKRASLQDRRAYDPNYKEDTTAQQSAPAAPPSFSIHIVAGNGPNTATVTIDQDRISPDDEMI